MRSLAEQLRASDVLLGHQLQFLKNKLITAQQLLTTPGLCLIIPIENSR